MWWSLILYFVAAFLITSSVLYLYGNLKRLKWYVVVAVLSTWCLNFAALLLIPPDVSGTFYRHCLSLNPDHPESCTKPATLMPESALIIVWKIVYWFAQVMTWAILPLLQSYVDAADFTFFKKLGTAIKENLLIYLSLGVIFGLCLIYIIVKNLLDFTGIVGIAMAASNTWGLTCLVALLGYGLVDVPRRFSEKARRSLRLQNLYFTSCKVKHEMDEANDDLLDATKEIMAISQKVSDYDPLRPHVNKLKDKIPERLMTTSGRNNVHVDDDSITLKGLVKLHRSIKIGLHVHERAKAQWEENSVLAMEIEDILDGKFILKINPESNIFSQMITRLVYIWKLYLSTVSYWLLSFLCSIMSIIIIWSESLFFVSKPVLSVTALIIHKLGTDNLYMLVEMFSMIFILYIGFCTFSTVFRIRVFNYFHLCPNHHSDAVSLLFSAVIVSRLIPALTLNFLSINHLDGHIHTEINEETAFTQIMGHMEVVGFIANGFMVFFPAVIILLAFASFMRVFNRCLYDDDLTQDLIDEGRDMIRNERRRLGNVPINSSDSRSSERPSYSSSRATRDSRRPETTRYSPQIDIEHQTFVDETTDEELGIFDKIADFFAKGSDNRRNRTRLRPTSRSDMDVGLLSDEDDDYENNSAHPSGPGGRGNNFFGDNW